MYPLDLSNVNVVSHIYETFQNAVLKYGAEYLKIDFLIRSLVRQDGNEDIIVYPGEYCVALYRNAMTAIRKAVGKDTFLLCCGAPIGESIGIFDAMRVSPDITWGIGAENHPGYWNLIKWNTRNILLRSFFHKNIFLNDPDGLVVRDNRIQEDDFEATYDEARVWATSIAMSGGAIIINEDMKKLGADRLKLFEGIIPPYGKAAKPIDFFEQSLPSASYIEVDNTPALTSILAVYNWNDEKYDREIKLDSLMVKGAVIAVNCWEKNILGMYENSIPLSDMKEHSVEAILLKEVSDKPMFLFCDNNFYMGADMVREVLNEETNELFIQFIGIVWNSDSSLFIYVPNKYGSDDNLMVVWENIHGKILKDSNINDAANFRYRFTNDKSK